MGTTRFDQIGTAGSKGGSNTLDPFLKTVQVPVVAIASGAEQDTGIAIPSDAVQLVSAVVDVITPEATAVAKTLTVGVFGGDADGFMTATSVAASGFVGAPIQVPVNGGGNIAYTLAGADFAELDGVAILTFVCRG